MPATIITKEDLDQFTVVLIEKFKILLEGKYGNKSKRWIRSKEVREILNISPGTLQNLRNNGTLPHSRIGTTIYYDMDKILKILDMNEIDNKF